MSYFISVQSASRPNHVELMRNALPDLELNWFIPNSQKNDYKNCNIYGVNGSMPMKVKQLNSALDIGFETHDYVITMDVDFVNSSVLDNKKAKKINLKVVIEDLIEELSKSPYYLAGVSGTTNPFYSNDRIINKGMLTGRLLVHKKNELRYDETCTFLEDLDFVINHHITHNGIVRLNKYLIDYHIYGKSDITDKKYFGGYNGYRNLEEQNNILKYIQNKYNNEYIKFPTENEVGKSLTKSIKWKKFNKNNNLESFFG